MFVIFMVVIGKIILLFKKSNFAGVIINKLVKNPLLKFNIDAKIVLVVGSTSKTVTINAIKYTLSDKKVISNISDNSYEGILATLLKGSNIFGKIEADYVVIEADKNFDKWINSLKVDYLIVTNILDNTSEFVEKIERNISQNTIIIVNKNDVITSNIKHKNKYNYELDYINETYDKKLIIPTMCPRCESIVNYSNHHFGYIGKFSCSCGYNDDIDSDLFMKQVDLDGRSFIIDGVRFKVKLDSLFLYYSILSCISFLLIEGYSLEKIALTLSDFESNSGREKTFYLGDISGALIYVKSGYGLDMHLRNFSKDTSKKVLVFNIQDDDMSWIYDTDMSFSKEGIEKVLVVGKFAYELKIRLMYAGFYYYNIVVVKDIKEALIYLNLVDSKIYLYSTKKEMNEALFELIKYPENKVLIGDKYA